MPENTHRSKGELLNNLPLLNYTLDAMSVYERVVVEQENAENGQCAELYEWITEGEGASAARYNSLRIAAYIIAAWDWLATKYGEDDGVDWASLSFDWDFVPQFLEEMMDHGPAHGWLVRGENPMLTNKARAIAEGIIDEHREVDV